MTGRFREAPGPPREIELRPWPVKLRRKGPSRVLRRKRKAMEGRSWLKRLTHPGARAGASAGLLMRISCKKLGGLFRLRVIRKRPA